MKIIFLISIFFSSFVIAKNAHITTDEYGIAREVAAP